MSAVPIVVDTTLTQRGLSLLGQVRSSLSNARAELEATSTHFKWGGPHNHVLKNSVLFTDAFGRFANWLDVAQRQAIDAVGLLDEAHSLGQLLRDDALGGWVPPIAVFTFDNPVDMVIKLGSWSARAERSLASLAVIADQNSGKVKVPIHTVYTMESGTNVKHFSHLLERLDGQIGQAIDDIPANDARIRLQHALAAAQTIPIAGPVSPAADRRAAHRAAIEQVAELDEAL